MAVMMRRGAPLLVNRLSRLMGDRRLNIQAVADGTGLTRKTIHDLYHNKSVQIHLDTLDKLCAFFQVSPNDVFEWQPTPPDGPDGERRAT